MTTLIVCFLVFAVAVGVLYVLGSQVMKLDDTGADPLLPDPDLIDFRPLKPLPKVVGTYDEPTRH